MPEIMTSCMPELSNDVPSLPFPQGWGLGFHLTNVDLPGMRSAGTGDWAGLFNTYYWIDRSAGVGGAIMTQVLPFFDAKVVEALLGFEVAVYAQVGAAVAPSG
jgi:methyl acetate hydrolase